jgi:hypothetical protein
MAAGILVVDFPPEFGIVLCISNRDSPDRLFSVRADRGLRYRRERDETGQRRTRLIAVRAASGSDAPGT